MSLNEVLPGKLETLPSLGHGELKHVMRYLDGYIDL